MSGPLPRILRYSNGWHVWEPSTQDWATARTSCPRCGGWVMTAALHEPTATDTAAHAEHQRPG